uniref:hypothetical protein n=1 Tax=Flavobacterium sp. TaxID=239 RepID=UPI00404A7117
MKNFYTIIIIVVLCFFSSSYSQKNIDLKNILEFESYFGLKQSKELTFLISELEFSLKKKYQNDNIEICYLKFIEEYKFNKTNNIELTEDFKKLINNKKFLKNFYSFRKENKFKSNHKRIGLIHETKDENKIRDINQNFFISLQNVNNLDNTSKKYIDIIVTTNGNVDYSILSNFFENKADYTNYFHTRLFLVFFFI